MLTELQLQSLVVKSVRDAGGVAWKLSNRFLVGVPDLLILLPKKPIGIWEVKRKLYKAWPATVPVEVTPMQDKYLSELHGAGGVSGVIGFVGIGSDLFMVAFRYGILAYSEPYIKKFEVAQTSYQLLERGKRSETISSILERAYVTTD